LHLLGSSRRARGFSREQSAVPYGTADTDWLHSSFADTRPRCRPSKAEGPMAGPYRRGTWREPVLWGKLVCAQVAEVGRYVSGAVTSSPIQSIVQVPRAIPYSGYSLRQHPRLIPFKRVPNLRDLASI
jgi:hypothetical protein